jgi:type II secretory pathway pseudopilin PulG
MHSQKNSLRLRGFSIIELLAAFTVLAILVAITIVAIGNVRQSALKVGAISDLRSVGIALMSYAQEHQQTLPGPSPLGVHPIYSSNVNSTELASALAPYLEYTPPANLPSGSTGVVHPLVCPGFLRHQSEISYSYPHYVQNYTIPDVPLGRIFGRYASGPHEESTGLRLYQLEELGGPSRVWALTNLDQRVSLDHPEMASSSITSSGWYSRLPPEPVWGDSRLRVYLDGRVDSVPRDAAP